MYNNITGNVSSHLPSSSTATAPRKPTISCPFPRPHRVHHPFMIHRPPPPPFFASGSGGGGDGDGDGANEFPRRDERFPQWSNQETRDFIEIRAQLEWDFTTSKRNKNLWETVAYRMKEKGYRRTSDQCKCKWKNLVNRYKGQEAFDLDNSRQCPFFDELHAFFTARANRMHQAQLDAETGTVKGRKRVKNVSGDQSHEEFSEKQQEEEDVEVSQAGKGRTVLKVKSGKEKQQKIGEAENDPILSPTNVNKHGSILNSIQQILRNFILQQQMIDMQWRESMEKRAEERELLEREWRQKMEKLERERLTIEQAWREREEERRLREESRAEKRDALLTTLLNKLVHDESP